MIVDMATTGAVAVMKREEMQRAMRSSFIRVGEAQWVRGSAKTSVTFAAVWRETDDLVKPQVLIEIPFNLVKGEASALRDGDPAWFKGDLLLVRLKEVGGHERQWPWREDTLVNCAGR